MYICEFVIINLKIIGTDNIVKKLLVVMQRPLIIKN